jgi:hypothetical protein
MGYSFLQLFVAIFALSLSVTFGLFEEQAGEYDWKIDNIGVIQQSFSKVCSSYTDTIYSWHFLTLFFKPTRLTLFNTKNNTLEPENFCGYY